MFILIASALFITTAFGEDYPCTFEVLSIDHSSGQTGTYFNFDIGAVDGMLGRTDDWSNENFNVYNSRTQQVKKVMLWKSANGGSSGDGHGREDDGTAAEGDFEVGDVLSFRDIELNCQPPCSFDVLSVDHSGGTVGQYFNFMNDLVDNILDRTDDWSNENFNVYNSRTKQIKKVILWKSVNGGSNGDGHGREDDGTAAPGDFEVDDQISFVGIPTFCESRNCQAFAFDEYLDECSTIYPNDLDAIRSDISSQGSRIGNLETDVNTLKDTTVPGLDSRLSTVENDVDTLKSQTVTELRALIDDNTRRLDEFMVDSANSGQTGSFLLGGNENRNNLNVLSENKDLLLLISLLINIFVLTTSLVLCYKLNQQNKYSKVSVYASSDDQ